ncbi:MAG TPA: VOC family protein [Candidatus Binataceae bacterium]|nr:VOC family protein [Candidatus Binataceae bacterium]
MIKSRGLHHINLNVTDLERSLKFYQRAFGLEVQSWEDNRRMVFLRSPGATDTITLCQVDKGDPVAGGGVSHFGFSLTEKDKLDEAIAQIESAGGKLLSRGKHGGHLPYAYISDPDGYVIELGNG